MPKCSPKSAVAAVDVRIANTLWQWLVLGVVAVALLPAARGDAFLIGWMPFWLVVVPGVALVTVHRHVLAAAWRARRRHLSIRSGAPTFRARRSCARIVGPGLITSNPRAFGAPPC